MAGLGPLRAIGLSELLESDFHFVKCNNKMIPASTAGNIPKIRTPKLSLLNCRMVKTRDKQGNPIRRLIAKIVYPMPGWAKLGHNIAITIAAIQMKKIVLMACGAFIIFVILSSYVTGHPASLVS